MNDPPGLGLTLSERDLLPLLQRIGLNVTHAQALGLEPPAWFMDLLRGAFVANRVVHVDRQATLLLAAAIRAAAAALPPEMRAVLEDPIREPIPDGLGPDLE